MERINGMRHAAIHDPAQYKDKRVAVIGVGTIGSHLALTLARMQVPLLLYDADTIEEHNIATQSYGQADIGKKKVDAVATQILAVGSYEWLTICDEEYKGQPIDADIIVSTVDSLEARRVIAKGLIEYKVEKHIVDGRVGREQVEAYTFPNAQAWLDQLPEEGDEDPCGARFTAYTANIAAGLLANNVKRLLMGQTPPGRIIYDAATSIFIKE